MKRRRIISFWGAPRRDAAVPCSNQTQRVHLCAGTGFSAPRLLWVHKEQRLAEQLVQSEPGTPGGEIQQPPDTKSPRLRIFTPSTTLSRRRHRRFGVSISFDAFKRGRMAAERFKPLSLWLPERGCFCRKWRHRPLVSAWPRRGEEYFQRVVAASKRRVCLLDEEIRHRGVLGSVVGGEKRSCVAIWLRGRTRKDGRVTGPVRQAASWKRWHRAAKRSVFFSRQCPRNGLRVHPDDRWWSGDVTRLVLGVFAGLVKRVFVWILFVLARLYAALRCHAAIVTRGLSLTAGKVPFFNLPHRAIRSSSPLCGRRQWRSSLG